MNEDAILSAGAVGNTGEVLGRAYDECGLRTLIVPSPGSRTNFAVIREGPKAANAIGFMRNVGTCNLFLNALDANGNPLHDPARDDRGMLAPGESVEGWRPPPGAVKVVVAASYRCSTHAELEWDPCAYYA